MSRFTLFQKLAFAQQVLRIQGGIEKRALLGAIGTVGKGLFSAGKGLVGGAGKVGGWAVQNPGKALGVGLGALAIGSELKAAPQKSKAFRAGFDPNVQSYQSQQF
jgi:hypothetical protein